MSCLLFDETDETPVGMLAEGCDVAALRLTSETAACPPVFDDSDVPEKPLTFF